ncbi:MAG: PQQ-binding-like beta-propeller repeat protein [Planctomycetota bacterium]
MRQLRAPAVLLILGFYGATVQAAVIGSALIPETTANRHGLTREWFVQAEVDRSRGEIDHAVIDGEQVFVQTDRAILQAFDAKTGKTQWLRQLGNPNYPSMRPGVGHDWVVAVNGSRVYVINRYNGALLYEQELRGAPGAGAAVGRQRAYVPMIDGKMLAYPITLRVDPEEESVRAQRPAAAGAPEAAAEAAFGAPGDAAAGFEPAAPADAALGGIAPSVPVVGAEAPSGISTEGAEDLRRAGLRLEQEVPPPLSCSSMGRGMVQPLVIRDEETMEMMAWATDRGYLSFGLLDFSSSPRLSIKYRLQTAGIVQVPPVALPAQQPTDVGIVYVACVEGYVYAVEDRGARVLWRYSTGNPIYAPMARVQNRLFVASETGGMHCLDAVAGKSLWWAPDVTHFIAMSNDRVYAAAGNRQMVVLNAANGARIDTIAVPDLSLPVANVQTDRIFLVSRNGLVQCLREIGLREPIAHTTPSVTDQMLTELLGRGLAPARADGESAEEAAPADALGPAPAAGGDPFGPPAAGNDF